MMHIMVEPRGGTRVIDALRRKVTKDINKKNKKDYGNL